MVEYCYLISTIVNGKSVFRKKKTPTASAVGVSTSMSDAHGRCAMRL
jgi:hypothetical protein